LRIRAQKLWRVSDFTHRVGLQGVQRRKKSLEDFRIPKAQEGQCCICTAKLKVKEFTERRETRVEGL